MTITDGAEMVAFLRARIDEDERVALAANGPRWEPGDGDVSEGGLYAMHGDDDGWSIAWFQLGTANESGPGLGRPTMPRYAHENSAHAARWDPARVLAEVQAKRAILDLHVPIHHPPDQYGRTFFPTCRTCSYVDDFGERGSVEWPCDTIKALLLPFADHPEYRKERRP